MCKSHHCEGFHRSKNTLTQHAKEDFMMLKQQQIRTANNIKLSGCSFDPSLYNDHKLAKTALYVGSNISVLDYIFLEFRKFVSHPLSSKEAVSENFRIDTLFKLPKPNFCPKNYQDAKSQIREFLVPLQTYHACPNDCILFHKHLANEKKCPVCNSKRFLSSGRPAKVFKYFPLIPRIARIYQTENLVKLLHEHSVRPDDGFLKDILDTDRWKKQWFGQNGEFNGLSSGCVLNFCTDGVNPFKTMHLVYSMWPMMVSVLNFPISFRKSVGGILLLGIIPGNGRKEPANLDPYMGLLVDELLILSDCHVYYPAYMNAPVTIKTRLLQFVLDFPGIAKLLQYPGSGAIMACPWCEIMGVYCQSMHKTVYLQNRRYLPEDHVLRSSNTFNIPEIDPKPTSLSADHEKQLRSDYETLGNNNQKKKFTRSNGVKGTYALMKLPYHKFSEHVHPDGMHTVADVLQHVLEWLIGNKNETTMINAENEMLSKKESLAKDAITTLTSNEKLLGNKRCKSLLFPAGCSGYKGDVFNHPKEVLKKTHGWTEVLHSFFNNHQVNLAACFLLFFYFSLNFIVRLALV